MRGPGAPARFFQEEWDAWFGTSFFQGAGAPPNLFGRKGPEMWNYGHALRAQLGVVGLSVSQMALQNDPPILPGPERHFNCSACAVAARRRIFPRRTGCNVWDLFLPRGWPPPPLTFLEERVRECENMEMHSGPS